MFKRLTHFALNLSMALGVSAMMLLGTALDARAAGFGAAVSITGTDDTVYYVRDNQDEFNDWFPVFDTSSKEVDSIHVEDLLATASIVDPQTIKKLNLRCASLCFTTDGWLVGVSPSYAVQWGSTDTIQMAIIRTERAIELAHITGAKNKVAPLKAQLKALQAAYKAMPLM